MMKTRFTTIIVTLIIFGFLVTNLQSGYANAIKPYFAKIELESPINVTYIEYSPSKIIEEDSVIIIAHIINKGNTSLVVDVNFTADNKAISSIKNVTLEPNTNTSVSTSWTAVAGYNNVIVQVKFMGIPLAVGYQTIPVKTKPGGNPLIPLGMIIVCLLSVLIIVALPNLVEPKLEINTKRLEK